MKKKIKDLTCKDLVNICKKNNECFECPLGSGCFGIGWCNFLPCNQEELLDKEIEVEEDD